MAKALRDIAGRPEWSRSKTTAEFAPDAEPVKLDRGAENDDVFTAGNVKTYDRKPHYGHSADSNKKWKVDEQVTDSGKSPLARFKEWRAKRKEGKAKDKPHARPEMDKPKSITPAQAQTRIRTRQKPSSGGGSKPEAGSKAWWKEREKMMGKKFESVDQDGEPIEEGHREDNWDRHYMNAVGHSQKIAGLLHDLSHGMKTGKNKYWDCYAVRNYCRQLEDIHDALGEHIDNCKPMDVAKEATDRPFDGRALDEGHGMFRAEYFGGSDPGEDDGHKYKVVRFHKNGSAKTLHKGLTLGQAQAHCHHPETSSSTCKGRNGVRYTKRYGDWFDGYDREKRGRK